MAHDRVQIEVEPVQPVDPLLRLGHNPVCPRLQRSELILQLRNPLAQALHLGAVDLLLGLLGTHRFSAIRGASRLNSQTPRTNVIAISPSGSRILIPPPIASIADGALGLMNALYICT